MCGICGKHSPISPKPVEIYGMLEKIAHRGPDDEGIYIKGPIGLGNRRLSVIDILGGKQPMSNEDEKIWIVNNGEIYNYKQLRQELEQKGHHFRTESDTEVIVHMYEEMGEHCVIKLRGMFAFAIWDDNQQKLVLARDRLGQKPLFYTFDGESFLFASELKALLAESQQARKLDYISLHYYLSLRFIPSPRTMLENFWKLPPAHILIYRDGEIYLERYWNLSFNEKLDQSESVILEELRYKLLESMNTHLVSDVPIGTFLSGGLDSSMIVAMVSQDLKISLPAFTIGVREDSFNESPFAIQVAEHHKSDHIQQCTNSNIFKSLPKMIWHMDEPSDPIAACIYQAANLASHHVKVVLGGDGGDELFAGFDRYRFSGILNTYRLLPYLFRQKWIEPVLNYFPDSFAYKSTTQKMRWIHRLSTYSNPAERYAEATCFFRFSHRDKHHLYSDDLWEQTGGINASDVIMNKFNEADSEDLIDKMLYADYMTRLPEHTLMLTDRMTMAHQLEARSPYLDHELVQFLAAFPSDFKINQGSTKYIFRRLARDYLPEQIVNRDKQGFMLPIAQWFNNKSRNLLDTFLLSSFFVEEGLFKKSTITRLIDEHHNNRVDHHVRLWMLLNLEIWHQIYFQRRTPEEVGDTIQNYL